MQMLTMSSTRSRLFWPPESFCDPRSEERRDLVAMGGVAVADRHIDQRGRVLLGHGGRERVERPLHPVVGHGAADPVARQPPGDATGFANVELAGEHQLQALFDRRRIPELAERAENLAAGPTILLLQRGGLEAIEERDVAGGRRDGEHRAEHLRSDRLRVLRTRPRSAGGPRRGSPDRRR